MCLGEENDLFNLCLSGHGRTKIKRTATSGFLLWFKLARFPHHVPLGPNPPSTWTLPSVNFCNLCAKLLSRAFSCLLSVLGQPASLAHSCPSADSSQTCNSLSNCLIWPNRFFLSQGPGLGIIPTHQPPHLCEHRGPELVTRLSQCCCCVFAVWVKLKNGVCGSYLTRAEFKLAVKISRITIFYTPGINH